MVAKNPITGDLIKTKTSSNDLYQQNYDLIFRKKKEEQHDCKGEGKCCGKCKSESSEVE